MKKIMFNDRYGLTQAVLNGRKTMTRRICPDGTPLGNFDETLKHSRYKIGEEIAIAQCYEDAILDVGEENWNKIHKWYNINYLCHEKGLHNKMFVRAELMPHRIRITDIKVERLQEISDEDCTKEGIMKWRDMDDCSLEASDVMKNRYGYYGSWYSYNTPKEAFAALIDNVSWKGTWKSNPWMFAYTFELVKGGYE